MRHYDLAVIGCGSGGFGTALAAARAGLDVVVIEHADQIGGNANRCGVNNWEAGAGSTGFPFEVYRRLKAIPCAVGIYGYARHFLWSGRESFPGGEHTLASAAGRGYANTLIRHGANSIAENEAFIRNNIFGVTFEPFAYERVLTDLLLETGTCTVIKETGFADVSVSDNRVISLSLDSGETLKASYYVDGTGNGDLCAVAGCEIMIGQEPRSRFDEPMAPDSTDNRINGVSLIFRISRKKNGESVDPLLEGIPDHCWWQRDYPFAAFFEFPNGDFNVNTLPTMDGQEYLDSGPAEGYAECRRRVLSWWYFVQREYPEFRYFSIRTIAPAVGVRESRRIVGEYVLTQMDCTGGIDTGLHPDIIAIADHQFDRHGGGAIHTEVPVPYGIPYRCLIPKGFSNLLIACRAASFSSIAASSCRLSRTMMHIGQAAGSAVALAAANRIGVQEVPPTDLQESLRRQHVQLEWPTPPNLVQYLKSE